MHRNYIRANRRALELQEEKQKSIEAELVWLKNQLNPHFLFNSLNNISSLTHIDPDQAQEAIAQLSDLLRYALYESQKPLVPLVGEVEFMQNYIAMMKLRCSDKTEVVEDFQIGTGHEQIAPLLFVSFIENAFKHGTSSNLNSRIGVSLQVRDGKIIFECRNTNLPKDQTDHSGSGIGLENTRRRLDLCYPNRYSWEQKVENDEYYIKIEILL
ncbi:MAG: histidine kinase [Bacteroidales bacterium]|nr:histidine kinase [Bacteroidales bacterium]